MFEAVDPFVKWLEDASKLEKIVKYVLVSNSFIT